MTDRLVLASGSAIRQQLLRNAGVSFEVIVARVDEDAIRNSLLAEAANPRDIADTLAEFKARRVAEKHPDALVIGCDQILEVNGKILSKPETTKDAREHLSALRNTRHQLLSAAVIYEKGMPVWRHTSTARLQMRPFSDAFMDDYIDRNWDSIRHSVGCYKLEEEGVRLFSRIEGDYFTILGLPLLEILSYLTSRGTLTT